MGHGLAGNLFAQAADPDLHILDVVTVPGVIWLFGVAVWFFAALGRRQGKSPRWKWFLAYGIVAFAAYAAWTALGSDPDKQLGFGPFLRDVASRAQYGNKRLVVAVWLSFVGPILTLALMWLFDKIESKKMAELVS